MMNIKNPTESDVTINFKGENFTVAAGATESLPNDVVNHWVSIHSFMLVTKEADKPEKKEDKKEKKGIKKVLKK
jgi:hypothetical protein